MILRTFILLMEEIQTTGCIKPGYIRDSYHINAGFLNHQYGTRKWSWMEDGHHPVPPTAIFPPIRMTSYLQMQTPKLKPHFLRRGMSGMRMTVHKTLHLNRNICRICIHLLYTFKIFASMYTVYISSNCRCQHLK